MLEKIEDVYPEKGHCILQGDWGLVTCTAAWAIDNTYESLLSPPRPGTRIMRGPCSVGAATRASDDSPSVFEPSTNVTLSSPTVPPSGVTRHSRLYCT